MESSALSNDVKIQDAGIDVKDFKFIKGSIIDELLFDNGLMTTTPKFDKFSEAKTIESRFGEVVAHNFCKWFIEAEDRVPCFFVERKDHSREIIRGILTKSPGFKTRTIRVPILINGKYASHFLFTIREYDESKLINRVTESLIRIEKVAEWSDPYSIAAEYIDTNYSAFGISVSISSFNVKESEISRAVKELMNSIRR